MEEQQQDLITFMEITGASGEMASKYLQVSEGNVTQAISLYMESGGADLTFNPQPPPTTSSFRSTTSTDMHMPDYEDVMTERAPIAPVVERLVDHSDMFEIRGTRMQPSDPFSHGDSHEPNDRLSHLFKPPIEIMFQGGIDEGRSTARNSKKWLMITVVDKSEFGCMVNNRDLWSDADVKELILNNFIFLYLDIHSSDGERHSTFYPIDSYPYVAIIDPMTGERLKTWSYAISPVEFQCEVLDFLENPHPTSSSSSVNSKKLSEKSKPISQLSEEEQMNMALRASLGENIHQEGDVIVIDDDEEEEVKVVGLDTTSVPTKTPSQVCASIQPLNTPEPTSSTDTCRLQFRLPNGNRLVRLFRKVDKVETLFAYIKSQYPEGIEKPFELMNFRQPLLQFVNKSIQEVGLNGASLTLDFL